ncbi:branched-chain amino acid ABC transporter permease [Sphingopyxis sp.]|jgi:branched-chain amino acid transport system permease protein|uniref:branched-chain amino acid ABC transporter permease n=1 Tax=Sphingopyxis sp. TaxID=1908224 RepID=UPI002DEC2635|nr:branched-chain amino acid ABC transporter permease [Sphingopyxis sp.]
MEQLVTQLIDGISAGSIYACMALSVVMIYQAINHLNFAQGEMAMFSTYLAWQLLQWGLPYWVIFPAIVAASFAIGYAVERAAIHPLRGASELSHVVVFIALFSIFNSAAGFIWGFGVKSVPSPFGEGPLFEGALLGKHQAGILVVTLVLVAALWVFLRLTRVGLAMRAAAANPRSARLVGIPVERVGALGWGLASAIGAVAGMLIAPIIFLDPGMMMSVLLYGFAGAVLGGLTSPLGAVLGGLTVGIFEKLVEAYVPVVGEQLKLPIALAVIIAVLLFRPSGFLGQKIVQRV